MKKIILAIAVLVIGVALAEQLKTYSRSGSLNFQWPSILPKSIVGTQNKATPPKNTTKKDPVVLKGSFEEHLVKTIDQSLPSVVTVGINFTTTSRDRIQFDPTDPFGGFRRVPGTSKEVDQNIGSGFVVDENGLIITNKHVVSQEDAKYKVMLNDETTYEVEQIYRDPLNDLAILKISPKTKLTPLELGDSDSLKLGQTTIAIGTPLGEFANSVTTGIISGLGMGITAGSPFESYVEKLDNVIQTDAAISPGNSGGPLLNSSGQVIGINTAVSQEGSNIGFAIPVNTIKNLLTEFEKRGGSFERPYIGVRYQMIDRKTAIMNDLVEGAYITEVVKDSPADKAGLKADDVITKIDGSRISGTDEQSLAKILMQKNVGQTINVSYYRDGEEKNINITLEAFK
ncbi:MAG: trypsin-like peptidase domain-containing protein [Patescibacteria group bacterium]